MTRISTSQHLRLECYLLIEAIAQRPKCIKLLASAKQALQELAEQKLTKRGR